jgi:hypothetical protein
MVESWLLICRSIVHPRTGQSNAESTARSAQKHHFYGKPSPSRRDVEEVALPLIRQMTAAQITTLGTRSRSFAHFAADVAAQRATILGVSDCWQAGDGASNR